MLQTIWVKKKFRLLLLFQFLYCKCWDNCKFAGHPRVALWKSVREMCRLCKCSVCLLCFPWGGGCSEVRCFTSIAWVVEGLYCGIKIKWINYTSLQSQVQRFGTKTQVLFHALVQVRGGKWLTSICVNVGVSNSARACSVQYIPSNQSSKPKSSSAPLKVSRPQNALGSPGRRWNCETSFCSICCFKVMWVPKTFVVVKFFIASWVRNCCTSTLNTCV